jgi:hypothetical protein
MCCTLGIDSNAGEEKNTAATSEKDRRSRAMNRGAKIQKTRTLMNLASVLKSYDGIDSLDNDDGSDEVQEYFKSKLSIGDGENILHWWRDRSLIFPK